MKKAINQKLYIESKARMMHNCLRKGWMNIRELDKAVTHDDSSSSVSIILMGGAS